MVERVDWSELPEDLWPMIGRTLKSSIDVLRFRSICKSWRSSLPPSHAPSAYFPLRIFTSSRLGRTCLAQITIYRLEPSHVTQNSSISSSSKGWLVQVKESKYGYLSLFYSFKSIDPASKIYAYFPNVLNLLNYRLVEVFKSYYIVIGQAGYEGAFIPRFETGKAVLFPNFPWTKVENCMIFAIHQQGKLRFSKSGDHSWTLVGGKNFYCDDIIIHKGKLYVVDKWGIISWIDYSSLQLIQFSPSLYAFGKKKHLVESSGSLYVVDMYFEAPDPNHYTVLDDKVIDVKVYKLDEERGRWLDIKSLGEHMFVLCKYCNFSLSTKDYHGCDGNCIYFWYRKNAYVFSLESSTIKFIRWPSFFHPNFNLKG